ncbi:DMT family transporter [Candidatus Daviesbacteria bacterium]|nr:DMT family transporter [Candidatus Daviesbacteria bacterium]
MEAIIFALITYFAWGIGIFFEAIVARKLNPYSFAFWAFLLSVVVMSFYAPFILDDLSGLTVNLFLLNITLSIIALFLGSISYYEALKITNRALVGTIASSFPLVTVILSMLFLGEKVSSQQGIAIVIIFLGLFLAMFNINMISGKFLNSKGILFALLTMLSWGAYFAFIKILVEQIGWFWPTYFSFLIFPLIYFYMKIKKIKLERPTLNGAIKALIISTILVRIAELSFNLGISKGLVSIVAPIAGANPTLFVVLAFLIFKDPITRQQILGIITTLVGIVLLSIFSV